MPSNLRSSAHVNTMRSIFLAFFGVSSGVFHDVTTKLRFTRSCFDLNNLELQQPGIAPMPPSSRSRRTALVLVVVALLSPLVPSKLTTAAEKPLAIQGYDPVAYFTLGTPTRGLAEFEYEWDERRYRFSTAEHRDLFKADPVRYAPQFGNFCAMALSLGEIVVANPENWLISDGKLYVFGKPAPEGPVLFQKDLAANISKANGQRPILPKQ